MLIGLKKPLTPGEIFPLTLTFAKAGNISVLVTIQAMSAKKDDKGGMGDKGSMDSMGAMEDNKSGGAWIRWR